MYACMHVGLCMHVCMGVLCINDKRAPLTAESTRLQCIGLVAAETNDAGA